MTVSRGLLLAFALATASANAQNSGDADKLFDKGKQLMAQNKLAEACTAFEDSQHLAAAATTAMNLANCREKNDQLVTAHGQFMQVAKELEGKTDAGSKKLREVALQRAALLTPRLSKITLIIPSASQVRGLEIQLDARTIDTAQWNQPIPLDGGTYKLIARADDRIEWTTTVALAPSGDTKTIEVPALADAHPTVPVKRAPATGGSMKMPIIFGIAALGLGGAALGFELWGRSIYSDAEAELERDRQVELWDQANTRHYVAQGAGIAALGCAAAAIIFYVKRDKPTESSVAIAPVTSPTSVGLAAFARW